MKRTSSRRTSEQQNCLHTLVMSSISHRDQQWETYNPFRVYGQGRGQPSDFERRRQGLRQRSGSSEVAYPEQGGPLDRPQGGLKNGFQGGSRDGGQGGLVEASRNRPQTRPRDRYKGESRDRRQEGSWERSRDRPQTGPRDTYQGGSRDKRHGESWEGSRHRPQGGPRNRGQGGSRDRSTVTPNEFRKNGNTVNNPPNVKFGFRSLQSMMEKNPDELVLDMSSERCLPATDALLKQNNMGDQMIVQVLKVFARACDCETAHARLTKLLNRLPLSKYLSSHLSHYIIRMAESNELENQGRENEFTCMVKIFSNLLRKQPNCYPHLPLPQLSYTINNLADKSLFCNKEIEASMGDLMILKNEMAEKVKKEIEEMGKNPKKQRRRNEVALRDNEAPPDDFHQLNVIPTIQDIHTQGRVFLRRNKIDGSYDNPEHYLDVQFRLLREDFFIPLRDGIQQLLGRTETENMKFLQDIRVYNGVKVLYPIFTTKGLTYKISFDVSRMKRVRWENSKRLIYGSLLCLSNDNFETFILATVEKREDEELKEGRVEVRFTDSLQNIDLNKVEYQMVETTAYFEAYRHVLEGLKDVIPEQLPFQRYIVECEKDIQPPAYLRNRFREEVIYDLSPIMGKRIHKKRKFHLACMSEAAKSNVRNQNLDQGQRQSQEQSEDEGQSQSQEHSEDEGQRSQSQEYSEDEGQSQSQEHSEDEDQSQSQDHSEDEGQSQSQEHSEDEGQSQSQEYSEDEGQRSQSQEHSEDEGQSQSQEYSEDEGQSQSQEYSEDEGQSQSQDHSEDEGQSQSQEHSEDEGQSQSQEHSEDEGQSQSQEHSEDEGQSQSQEHSEDEGQRSQSQEHSEDEGQSQSNEQNQYQVRSQRINKGKSVRILDMDSWPSAEDLELDSSQLKAVQLALTKEFAIIQGPPGTGKTYIGLKVVKVLLHNKRQWERGTETLDTDIRMLPRRQYAARPILVVCYTNHALDQFLEGIQEFHSKGIVRVGGRSQSEKMQACSLNEIKHKERQVPRDIVHAISEAKRDLQSISDEMEAATINLQKCTENIIHELELEKADVMTKEQFESMVKPFRDPYQKDNVTVKSVMLYWLNLFPDPNNLQMHSGLFVKPVARFAFDHASNVINLVNPSHRAVLNQVHSKPGLHGRRHGSFELQGSRDSYILIPNGKKHLLDTRYSMTILMNVYPMNRRGGPILCFHCPGFNGIQILQNGVQNGKGVLSVSFARRDGVFYKPLTKAVLNLNEWNFIGASYDHHTGHTRLWHNGKMVQNQINPKMEIASHLPVYIGSLNLPGRHHSYFKGRVCSLEIYSQDIGEEQIMAIAGIREEHDKKDNDVLFEADAMQEQRMLDDYQRNQNRSTSQRQTLQIADQFDKNTQICNQDNFEMHLSSCQKMKIRETIKRELSNQNKMTIPEAAAVRDVWRLTNENRWRLYRRWITHLSSCHRNTVSRNQKKFEDSTQELKEAQSLEDLSVLENADVIGMTTTGAAKYRELIQKIKPRITIVEEAAEVLESHIVTSLSPGCQHLILIGDHQQLRPSPNVYRLATDYNLDISLFERMFKNGIRIEKLVAQHRMRPEIARMMGPIYKDLENHESVLNLENIKGVTSNIFFIEHTELEELIEEGMSRSNIHEAKYLAALCRYFILQGYERHQITVLTMYTGQLIQLKKEMPRDFFQGVRICAVDNFQGEENDIILLSLVRSNEEGKIGFLRISNRVCVALSRAKKGFFCIGNLELMCEQKDSLWNEIIDDMRAEGKVGSFMTLMCQNHPKTIIHASKPEDFLKAPEGGCMEPCKARLECGHVCKMSCHPTDPKHDLYKCQENCLKSCERDHKCKQLCYEKCKPCDVYVWKKIPSCGHDQKVPCHMDPKDFKCRASCERSCKQDHKCKQLCYEKCKPCDVYVWKKIPSCGHDQKVPCHMDPKDFKCRASCERSCKQDHKCKQLCYEKCKPCNVYVWKRMPLCGHDQKVPCHMDPKEFKCQKPCKGSCDQGHKCKQLCYEECKPCDVLVRKTMPSCGHDQKVPCHMDPKGFKCQASCSKILSCQHPCQNKCFESCTVKCLQIVPKLLRCGHEKEVECHLKPDKAICTASCKVLLKCNHQCKGNCSECFGGRLHKPCQENCDRTLLCGHTGSEACTNSYTACQKKCEKKCPHSVCKKICAEPCIPCTEPCNWKCEHFKCTKTCSEPCDRPRCNKPCKKKPFKKCYHRCIGMCGEPCPKKCRVCDKDEVTRHLFGDEDKTDARFVEVRPCGHVIEVQAMDMWMDECTSDTLSIIQLKGCPRCKTPITTCKRYGKIIKKTLNDIEKVKVETFVDKEQLIKEAHKLKQLISAGFLKYFPEEAKHINRNIDRKNVKSDRLNLYENQIYFMNHLSKLLKIHNRLQAELNRQPLQRKVVKNFGDSILDFVSKVMAKERNNFCNQEKEELRDEIHRVLLIFSFEVLRTEMGHPVLRSENLALDSMKETIESGKRIDETTCKRYMEQLEQLHKEFNTPFMSADHFKIEKQKVIVKMIHLTQEHWFKCPEGHIYYTHESGATEKIPCPTCKSTEEDTRQVVADDNQLIDEMDGGQLKPKGAGQLKPIDAGQVKPKDAGQDKSKGAGQIKFKGAGQVVKRKDAQVKPKGAGQDKSKGAGQVKPKDASQVKPKGADKHKPKDAGQVKPKDAGQVKPKDAGQVKPKGAGQVKPRDSGQVKRKDAKQVKRKDAGQAKLKDSAGQFKRKDSGQVKLPT